MGLQTSDVKFFENGFLMLNYTGGTTGAAIIGLQDITLSYSVDVQELQGFDTNFNKLQYPSYKSWSVSCSGFYLSVSGETYSTQSGDTHITGGQSGKAILQQIKNRGTSNKIVIKLGTSDYQTGTVILTSFEVSASAGETITFSLEMTGSGELVYSTV